MDNTNTATGQLPDGVAHQLPERKERAAMTEEQLREHACHAKREDMEKYLAASPDVPPMPGDEL